MIHARPYQRRRLRQLAADQGGNTLMMAAGMFLPLLAFAGAGMDMSRGYMAKARLQSACDAGVLAARKLQVGNQISGESRDAAGQYFRANFGKGSFGSYDTSFTVAMGGAGRMVGTATTTLDTSLMRVFGQQVMNVSAHCNAIRDLSHSDVMFVFDVTGSMAKTNPGDAQNRMETLKDETLGFFDALETGRTADTRLRYGFLPYTELVSVGYLLNSDWMVNTATYQSRRPDGKDVGTTTQAYAVGWRQTSGSSPKTREWTYEAERVDIPALPATEFQAAQPARSEWRCTSTPPDNVTKIQQIKSERREPFAGPPPGERIIQEIEEERTGVTHTVTLNGSICNVTETTYDKSRFTFDWIQDPAENQQLWWMYEPIQYDVRHLKGLTTGGEITAPIGNGHTDRTVQWHGCIEERATVRDATYDPLPAGALDLDIDLVPRSGDPDTQWRPAIPEFIYMRNDVTAERGTYNLANLGDHTGGGANLCPPPARKLHKITRGDLQDYLATLKPFGGTHHDIGMLWGARLLSPSGIFAADNKGDQTRHMIFMTDGQIEVSPERQDSYGFPKLDRRRHDKNAWVTAEDLADQVEKRFLASCKAARARGITIWMIAFGTDLSPAMQQCAGQSRSFKAANGDELNHAMREIAGGIARLRLID